MGTACQTEAFLTDQKFGSDFIKVRLFLSLNVLLDAAKPLPGPQKRGMNVKDWFSFDQPIPHLCSLVSANSQFTLAPEARTRFPHFLSSD